MSNLETIVNEVANEINVNEGLSDKDKLDLINQAITDIADQQSAASEELQKAATSLQVILAVISGADAQKLFYGDVYDADNYEFLEDNASQALQSAKINPMHDFYLDIMTLYKELYFLGKGQINVGDNEFFYEQLDELKQKRQNYIEWLNTLPETLTNVYPNPSLVGGEVSIDLDFSTIEKGKELYVNIATMMLPPKELSAVGVGYLNILPQLPFVDPFMGLPSIEIANGGYTQSLLNTHITNINELERELAFLATSANNLKFNGTIEIVDVAGKQEPKQASYRLDMNGNQSVRISTHGLSSGTYIVRFPILLNGKPFTSKLVIVD